MIVSAALHAALPNPVNADVAFVGLDLGTSGVRGVAIDDTENELANACVPLAAPERDSSGGSQQDADTWWRATVDVLQQLTRKLAGTRIETLAVDGTSATLLLCDEDGTPLTPGLMYDDRRAFASLSSIREAAPADTAVHSATSSLAKLLYLRERMPLRPGIRALHQADWILGRLSGQFDISDENNCLKLGYDPLRRCWPGWMQRFALPNDVLPRVFPAGTPIGAVTAEAARTTGLPTCCRLVTGTTDSVAAAIAGGIARSGDAVTSLGSTLVLKILAAEPLFEPAYGIYSHRLGDVWLAGGASNSGGAVLSRFFSVDQIEQLSAGIDPNRPSGLDYYPLLRPGERFPVNDPAFPPRIRPRPADDARFLQGLLEGIAAIERLGYRLLSKLGAPFPARVVSIGGGAGNEVWRLLRQKSLGVPVTAAKHAAAAYGAACLGLRAFRGRGSDGV